MSKAKPEDPNKIIDWVSDELAKVIEKIDENKYKNNDEIRNDLSFVQVALATREV